MVDAKAGSSPRLLNPTSTAAFVLGASDWTQSGLPRAPSFLRSARSIVRYLYDPAGLALNPELVHDFFDDPASAADQLKRLRDTLDALVRERQQTPHRISDILVYYVGHGFTDEQGQLYLLIRRSCHGMEAESSIKAPDLARILRLAAPQQRRSVILDCCFSEAAARAFIGMGGDLNQQVAAVAMKDLEDDEPARGTILLCSSPVGRLSMGHPDAERTLFTGAVLDVLTGGAARLPRYISFSDLRDETFQRMVISFGAKAPRPVLHQVNAAHGDLTHVPAFPNLATIAQRRAEEERLKREAEVHAEAEKQRAEELRLQSQRDERRRAEEERLRRDAEAEAERQRAETLRLQSQRDERHRAEEERLKRDAEAKAEAEMQRAEKLRLRNEEKLRLRNEKEERRRAEAELLKCLAEAAYQQKRAKQSHVEVWGERLRGMIDVKLWSYRKIASIAFMVGVLGGLMVAEHLGAGQLRYVTQLFSAPRALYAGAVLVLTTNLAVHKSTRELAIAFVILYCLSVLVTFIENLNRLTVHPEWAVYVLGGAVRYTLLLIIVALLFRIPAVTVKGVLPITVAIGAASGGFACIISSYVLPDPEHAPMAQQWFAYALINGIDFCATAMLLTYSLRGPLVVDMQEAQPAALEGRQPVR